MKYLSSIKVINLIYYFYLEGMQSKVSLRQQKSRFKASEPTLTFENYQQKLQQCVSLNIKLKQLLQTIKSNMLAKKIQSKHSMQENKEEGLLVKLRKNQSKINKEIQYLTSNLNNLINENKKLKNEVNVSRNSRVIYSNVYKNIEKDIHKQQFQYKIAIIDYLCYYYTGLKLDEKIQKYTQKLLKDINQLENINRITKKNLEKKQRIRTGATSRLQSSEIQQTSQILLKQSKPKNVSRVNSVRGSANENSTSRSQTKKKTVKTTLTKKNSLAEQEDELQFEMKTNYYNHISKFLKQLLNCQNLTQAYARWQGIQNQLQNQYSLYLQYQQKIKKLDQHQQQLKQQLKMSHNTAHEFKKTQQQLQLQQIEKELNEQALMLKDNEEVLTKLIDLNVQELTDKEISHHVQRVSKKGSPNMRELQKLFEGVNKQIATHRILQNYHNQNERK